MQSDSFSHRVFFCSCFLHESICHRLYLFDIGINLIHICGNRIMMTTGNKQVIIDLLFILERMV